MTAADLAALIDGTDVGPVPVRETVVIRNTFGLTLDFKNRQLEWLGPPDQPMFQMERCDGCTFRNLRVWADRPGLSAFSITASPPDSSGFTSTNNKFESVKIHGPGLNHGFTTDHRIAGGPDANNDRMTFDRCEVNWVRESAWYFHGTQSMLHRIVDCNAHGNYVTKSFIRHDHNLGVAAVGCGGGSMTDYVFDFGPLAVGHGEITGGRWELCQGGLFRIRGDFVTPVIFPVRTVYFDQRGGSEFVIDVGKQVPAITFEDCHFEVQPFGTVFRPWRCRVDSHSAAQMASFTFNRNAVFHRKPGAPRPEFLINKNVVHRYGNGNQYWEYQTPKGVLVVPPGPRF